MIVTSFIEQYSITINSMELKIGWILTVLKGTIGRGDGGVDYVYCTVYTCVELSK
jgi:hypothetical protein